MTTVLITGGTGMVGKALTEALIRKGNEVIILSRSGKERTGRKGLTYASWDPEKGSIDPAAVQRADFIVHLAGANVAAERWTAKRKKEIRDSRVKSGQLLVKALQEIPNKVQALVSASGMGFYGPDPVIPNPHPFRETDGVYPDYLGEVVQQWENAVKDVTDMGKRLVIFRMGLVMSRAGGAYVEFARSLPFRIAAILGSGRQIISWIHIDDLVRLYIAAMEEDRYNGIYNAAAPAPVSNRDLVTAIARARGGFFLPVHIPGFVLKTVLGEMSIEVLKSTTLSADKVQKTGFVFSYPDIGAAIRQLEAS